MQQHLHVNDRNRGNKKNCLSYISYMWKELVMANLRLYPGICLEGLKKANKKTQAEQPLSGLRLEPRASQR
jgi:hypothetical protein